MCIVWNSDSPKGRTGPWSPGYKAIEQSQIEYHRDAIIFMQNFIATMEQQRVSVYELAHSSHAHLIQQNRHKLCQFSNVLCSVGNGIFY